MSLGGALGLSVSGLIYSMSNNWQVPFIVFAMPTLLLPMVFIKILPQFKKKQKAEVTKKEKQIFFILKNKNIWFLNLAAFCSGYGFWVAMIWGPSFFATERHLNLTTAGILTAIATVFAVPSSLLIGRLSDRIGRRRLTLILYPLGATSVFTLTFVNSIPALVFLLIFYGLIGRTTSDTLIISWFSDYVYGKAPQVLGTAAGIFNFVGMTSAIVAPVISGIIKDITGSFNNAFYLGAFVVLIGTIFCFLLARIREQLRINGWARPRTLSRVAQYLQQKDI
jgi:cyanate permease